MNTQTVESAHNAGEMRLIGPAEQPVTSELKVMQTLVPLAGADILELGCGGAEKTRMLAERYPEATITAAEIDPLAHEKNLAIDDLPNVTFISCGAEDIPLASQSVDLVVMFKSLHHVPLDSLAQAFAEIHRVLRDGGHVYISEPVFDGPFNEIIRRFHDEEVVRQAAFDATVEAARTDAFDLAAERFFKNRIALENFAQFENGIINVTHTDHQLSDALLQEVRTAFEAHASDAGYVFEIPNRVDVLRKVARPAG